MEVSTFSSVYGVLGDSYLSLTRVEAHGTSRVPAGHEAGAVRLVACLEVAFGI